MWWFLILLWVVGPHVEVAAANGASSQRQGDSGTIESFSISPNGRELAEIVLGGAVSAPKEHVVLAALAPRGIERRTIFVGRDITQIFWRSDAELLIVQSKSRSDIILENINTGARRTVLTATHAISIAAFDRRRGLVAYEYTRPWRWRGRASVRMTDQMSVEELVEPKWARWPRTEIVKAIRIGSLGSGRREWVIPLKMDSYTQPVPPILVWRRGSLLAVTSAMKSLRTRIFDSETGKRIDGSMPLYRLLNVSISRQGQIAGLSTGLWKNHLQRRCGCNGRLSLYVVSRSGMARQVSALSDAGFVEVVSGLHWGDGDDLFAQIMGFKGRGGALRWWLEEIDAKTDRIVRIYRWPGGDLGGGGSDCEFDARRTRAICIGQTLTTPPVLAEVNLRDGVMRVLGKMNPSQHRLRFSFQKVRIPNRFGYDSTGFLAVPKDSTVRAVPLAVMAYGFTEAYSRDAQWITSYPVAKFVHAGIAVLMVNWPRIGAQGLKLTPYGLTKRSLEGAMSLFANAVPAVRKAGVRVSRAMVMGWSFGGLFAAHAIQSLHDYVAAQVGDPAAYNVTQYGLSNDFWRDISGWFFGGPPVGRYLRRYQYMDPAGDGKPAHGPILFEFVSRNPDAGQFLEEWRAVGTDVEAFAYHRSVHWLSVAAEARVSRQRNLDWAELNLFGPHAVKSSELARVGLTIPSTGWWNVGGVQ